MKKNCYVCLLSLSWLIFLQAAASPTITFFFKPLNDIEKVSQKLKKPGKLAKYTAHGILNHVPISGLLVTYGGYITSSNYNGQVILPRKHQKPVVTILVTAEMIPVSLFENTILHWNLIPGVPASMYSCAQKYDDKTEKYYWETQEVPLPEDNRIPLAAIVIVAKPKNIVVTIGDVPTKETANFVLPDIYVKKGINIVKNSSYMLTVRHLFKPIAIEEKAEQFKMITHIID
jgi:hypothetical protein